MTALVLRGDARSLPLPDGCADLIVTSPPYFGQRDYRDGGESMRGQIGTEETPQEYLAALLDCTREWVRVLKPEGSLFVNLGDKYSQRTQVRRSSHQPGIFPGKFPEFGESWAERATQGAVRMPHQNVISDDGGYVAEKSLMGLPWRYALACADQLGLILRRDIIWRKKSAMPESAGDRCATRHEYLFHLTKQPRYYTAIDEIREPTSSASPVHDAKRRQRRTDSRMDLVGGGRTSTMNDLGKLPESVWEMSATPLVVPEWLEHGRCCGGRKRPGCKDGLDHHAAFPFELPRRCILGWSPPAICLRCGDGRFPVTVSERIALRPGDQPGRNALNGDRVHGFDRRAGTHVVTRGQIIGYACTCTPFTDHPGTGKRGLDVPDHWQGGPISGGGFASQARYAVKTGPWREYHLDRWTPPPSRPAIIVDPFGGTGTAALIASVLGRNAVAFDLSADYCRLARWRINDPGERARAMQVPKPPPIPDGQASLFDASEAAS